MKFFSSRRLVYFIIAMIVTIALLTGSVLVRNRRATPPAIQQFGNDVAGIFARVVDWPVSQAHQGYDSISQLLSTYQENTQLRSKVDKLAQAQVRAQVLENENKVLKKQLKLNSTLTNYSLVNATVISRTPSSWLSQLVINVGQNAGIKKNMSVVAGKGLIGRISEVNKTTAKVELLSDDSETANRFAIQITNSAGKSVYGIITDFNRNTNRIIMGEVTSKIKLKKGDKVFTSGLGGITPKGLYVGKVERVTNSSNGLSKSVVIVPATDFGNIPVVSVAIQK
ncbi:rod shape-determining protein MreC [Periweissella beninensis]|uniref:Cell shape-determining protein MreC n=1 Tax=Periweissella beninensis TaxID=504936 RepID=A0ABT0VFV0_9LACO|nr:rod shape-determining protein MreC [Periweissella beninensis]MBM7543734.1 rod shape-determining protein MreC [Periweissella beninensis]MCM2436713.1 rod shape-determining protein MreC [Periweissella beninensis]MCT4395679.1 rod shape-determining protein MreC [Periweissella beninensis]